MPRVNTTTLGIGVSQPCERGKTLRKSSTATHAKYAVILSDTVVMSAVEMSTASPGSASDAWVSVLVSMADRSSAMAARYVRATVVLYNPKKPKEYIW